MSLRRATSDTDAPGSNVCSTSCRLNSRAKLGRLPGASHLLSTISATLVPAKKFGGNQITSIHRRRENGRDEALTLKRELPEELPLSGIRVAAEGHSIVVKTGPSRWDAITGQMLLDFEVAELAGGCRAAGFNAGA